MKRFDFIAEADARVLEYGETVVLTAGGRITPLARDTLRERRVKVVEDANVSAEEASLAPPAEIRTLAVGSDHRGGALRTALVRFLRGRGLAVVDLGAEGAQPVDYADVAAMVARQIASREVDAGIVIDGSGIGSAIAANKIAGVRAAMAPTEAIARYAREHNGVNLLTLGASIVTLDEARAIVAAWLETSMREPRYIRRLAKIRALERP